MHVPPIPGSAMGGPPIHRRGWPGAAHAAELCLLALRPLRLEGRWPVRRVPRRKQAVSSVVPAVPGGHAQGLEQLLEVHSDRCREWAVTADPAGFGHL